MSSKRIRRLRPSQGGSFLPPVVPPHAPRQQDASALGIVGGKGVTFALASDVSGILKREEEAKAASEPEIERLRKRVAFLEAHEPREHAIRQWMDRHGFSPAPQTGLVRRFLDKQGRVAAHLSLATEMLVLTTTGLIEKLDEDIIPEHERKPGDERAEHLLLRALCAINSVLGIAAPQFLAADTFEKHADDVVRRIEELQTFWNREHTPSGERMQQSAADRFVEDEKCTRVKLTFVEGGATMRLPTEKGHTISVDFNVKNEIGAWTLMRYESVGVRVLANGIFTGLGMLRAIPLRLRDEIEMLRSEMLTKQVEVAWREMVRRFGQQQEAHARDVRRHDGELQAKIDKLDGMPPWLSDRVSWRAGEHHALLRLPTQRPHVVEITPTPAGKTFWNVTLFHNEARTETLKSGGISDGLFPRKLGEFLETQFRQGHLVALTQDAWEKATSALGRTARAVGVAAMPDASDFSTTAILPSRSEAAAQLDDIRKMPGLVRHAAPEGGGWYFFGAAVPEPILEKVRRVSAVSDAISATNDLLAIAKERTTSPRDRDLLKALARNIRRRQAK